MANGFTKQETVQFDELLAGFNDEMVLSKTVNKFNTDPAIAERSNDIFFRPQPYIATSNASGLDQTGNFGDSVQLSVPATQSLFSTSTWNLTATELRDMLQEGRLKDAAMQKIASDVNVSINSIAAMQGSLVVKRTAAASGFDDVAQCDAIMNEQGVMMGDRYIALSTRDYNGMASNLAARQTMQGRPETAYDRAYIGRVAGFDALKLDYAPRLAAATATGVSITGANQFYTPVSTAMSLGVPVNVDNRFQTIGITVTGSTVKVGDAFTITGVNAVHHITKADTGQLKTFRIVSIVTGAGGTGTVQITPPIISAQGATGGEKQYQNVTATPAAAAPIVFLNTTSASANPFWSKDSIEILPGRIAWPTDSGLGVMQGTTDSGFQVSMVKSASAITGKVLYRVDMKYGVVNLQPEMSGIILFGQA